MTTTDHPAEPPLTRRQMRERRLTGALPVIGEDDDEAVAPVAPARPEVMLARPADPIISTPPRVEEPVSESVPLTRRQARAQELSRTGAIPVIPATPDPEPAVAADSGTSGLDAPEIATPEIKAPELAAPEIKTPEFKAPDFARPKLDAFEPKIDEPVTAELIVEDLIAEDDALAVDEVPHFDDADDDAPSETVLEQVSDPVAVDETTVIPEIDEDVAHEPVGAADAVGADVDGIGAAVEETEVEVADDLATDDADRPVLRPGFGAAVLAGETAGVTHASFDDILTRESVGSGSGSAPNALILPDGPSRAPLTAPVTATGEVLVTGTFNLPEGLGSLGHAPGTADGKDVDQVLIDGELPAASSPTPIAATAAVSQSKTPGEIIRPPAPEKGNKLMLILAITAGALALSLAGVVIAAFVTGAFQ